MQSAPAPAGMAPPPTRLGAGVPPSFWAWVRPLGGVGILAFLLWRLGTGPFLDGVRLIDGWALAAALGIGVLITVCCAWRWSLVAGGLGLELPLRSAAAQCYRSAFLNATLPGGVLGDVHRAVRHGRDVGDVGRGIRAVVWERTAGQVVQVAITMVVLLVFPSPVRSYLPVATALVVAGGLGAVLLARALPRRGPSRWAQALRTAAADIRHGLLAHRNWLGVLLASTVVVAGHLATFLLAARTAGSTAPLSQLVPLTFLALQAMVLPANVGGFGPREGVAAWAFGAAGLTASQGVATAMVYGTLVLVSSLPGAAVLVVRRIRETRHRRSSYQHHPGLARKDLQIVVLHARSSAADSGTYDGGGPADDGRPPGAHSRRRRNWRRRRPPTGAHHCGAGGDHPGLPARAVRPHRSEPDQ